MMNHSRIRYSKSCDFLSICKSANLNFQGQIERLLSLCGVSKLMISLVTKDTHSLLLGVRPVTDHVCLAVVGIISDCKIALTVDATFHPFPFPDGPPTRWASSCVCSARRSIATLILFIDADA